MGNDAKKLLVFEVQTRDWGAEEWVAKTNPRGDRPIRGTREWCEGYVEGAMRHHDGCGYPNDESGIRCSLVEEAPRDLLAEALALIDRFGGIDGAHHKQWVLDQVVRKLAGPLYDDWVRIRVAQGYSWDVGVAP